MQGARCFFFYLRGNEIPGEIVRRRDTSIYVVSMDSPTGIKNATQSNDGNVDDIMAEIAVIHGSAHTTDPPMKRVPRNKKVSLRF